MQSENLITRIYPKEFIEKQKRTPLFDSVKEYISKDMSDYHTPGHKQGKGISKEFLELVGDNIFKMDLTEIPNIDNLYTAETVIKESQELTAEAYGSDNCFFLVNGSTVGNNVMIMTVCSPGEKIIIPRNIHKSVMSAIILSGAIPIYIPAIWDEELGFSHGIDIEILESTLQEHSDAKAVMLVNPTYYGTTIDIQKVVNLVHNYNIPILVDEAHGPHFRFHPELPMSAVQAGADMVIQSTHKILSSLSQSSWLHINNERINVKRAKCFLQMLQSTSPSYILLTSLDVARKQMVTEGQDLLEKTIKLAEYARYELNKIPGVKCFGKEKVGKLGIHAFDPTKLVIDFTELCISGFKALDIMNYNHNIQSEMATVYNVLELVTIANDKRDLDRLIEAARDIATNVNYKKDLNYGEKVPVIPIKPKLVLSPREAFYAETENIPFKETLGRISSEIVSPYPPGIPVLAPGEEITAETLDYLQIMKDYGAVINGPEDKTLTRLKVVKQ